MSDNILVERDGFVGIITINRPEKLNSMTPEMAAALVAAVNDFNGDDGIRCVIITGAGERAFCAGSDIRTLDDYATPWDFRNRPDYCDAIRALLKPSIAAVNGYAFGGGLETAMTCDIRIASDNASCAAREIKLGWIGRPVQRRAHDHDGRPHRCRDRRALGPCQPGGAARRSAGRGEEDRHRHRGTRADRRRDRQAQSARRLGPLGRGRDQL